MATVTKEVLHLGFINEDGKTTTFRIVDPKEDLTAEQILGVMQTVIDRAIFMSTGGNLIAAGSAKVVETITDEYDINVN